MTEYSQTIVGIKNGRIVYVSDDALAQIGQQNVMKSLDMLNYYKIKTDLSGNTVIVYCNTSELEHSKHAGLTQP